MNWLKIQYPARKRALSRVTSPTALTDLGCWGVGGFWCTFRAAPKKIDLNYEADITYRLNGNGVHPVSYQQGYQAAAPGMPLATTTEADRHRCFPGPSLTSLSNTGSGSMRRAARQWRRCLPEVHDHNSFQYAIKRRKYASLCVRPAPFVCCTRCSTKQRLLEKLAAPCWARATDHRCWIPHDVSCIPDVEAWLPENKDSAN